MKKVYVRACHRDFPVWQECHHQFMCIYIVVYLSLISLSAAKDHRSTKNKHGKNDFKLITGIGEQQQQHR
jgi:hypothetical protein